MSKYERKAQSQRKHGPLSVSGASKAPAKPPISRPGWKGPGYIKKQKQTPRPSPTGSMPVIQAQPLPLELQQLLLNVVRDTFPSCLSFEELKPLLQEVNEALISRDLHRAFARPECLDAYTCRWTPSRALAYANLLASFCGDKVDEEDSWLDRLLIGGLVDEVQNVREASKFVCFGGGPAELLALAGMLRRICYAISGQFDSPASSQNSGSTVGGLDVSLDGATSSGLASIATSCPLHVTLVDVTDWSSVVSRLHKGLMTPPSLSKYASAAARAANHAFISQHALHPTFVKANVLHSTAEDLRNIIGPNPTFITLLLTLNELYSTSIPKTTAFLLKTTVAAPKGSFLLVVDTSSAFVEVNTPGSLDTDEENQRKRFPMDWLLDRALLETRMETAHIDQAEKQSSWVKVLREDDLLYKTNESLRFPGNLENLKLQVHLFKRL